MAQTHRVTFHTFTTTTAQNILFRMASEKVPLDEKKLKMFNPVLGIFYKASGVHH